MRVKAQFAKRLCQPYHTRCQRSNQAIISCHKTLEIAFEVSEASFLGCNKLISAAKLGTIKFLLFISAFFLAVVLFFSLDFKKKREAFIIYTHNNVV